jgi:hypothetical protein
MPLARLFRAVRHGQLPSEVRRLAGLPARERVLAHGRATDGTWLVGTPAALVVLRGDDPRRLSWAGIQEVGWNDEEQRLTVTEVGSFGERRSVHSFQLEEQGLLLQLVRERVQASIVLQRRVSLGRRRGFTVIGRRGQDGAIAWMVEYDAGVQPDDPEVSRSVEEALAAARQDVGETGDPSI